MKTQEERVKHVLSEIVKANKKTAKRMFEPRTTTQIHYPADKRKV